MRPESDRRREALGLAAAALAAFALRAWGIRDILPTTDDITHYYFALKARSFLQWLEFARGNPMHVVLDPFLAFAVSRLTSSVSAFRLPSLLLGAASVPLLQRLGRKLGGARVGWLACALLACSAPHFEWCRRIDFYSPLFFFTLLSVLTLLNAVEGGTVRCFVPHLLVQSVLVYLHPYAFIVTAIEGAWVASARRESFRLWLVCTAAICLLYAPWFEYAMRPYLAAKLYVWGGDPGPKGWGVVVSAVRIWGQATEDSSYLFSPALIRLETAAGAAYLVLFAAGCWALTREKAWSAGWALAAAFPWVGLAAIIALDRRFSFFFAPRQALFLLPFYLVLAAKGLEHGLSSARPAAVRWSTAALSAALVVSFSLVSRADLGALASGQRRRLREIEAVRSKAQPGDAFLFRDPDTAQAFLFEFDRDAFLRLDPPKLYDGRSQFIIPNGLVIQNGAYQELGFCLVNPHEDEAARLVRWGSIAARIAGHRAFYLDYFMPVSLLDRFVRATGLTGSELR
jgi:hypothetical protein